MSATAFETEDLTAAEVVADPYGYYGRLREASPVHWNRLHREWVVTGHAEVVWLIRRHDLFSSAVSPQGEPPEAIVPPIDEADFGLAEYLGATFRPLLLHDRPEHLAMRQAIHRWFTPRAVERWRADLRETARDLIARRVADGGMEVKSDFAVWLPLTTINWMLDVPQSDARHLHELADKMINLGFSRDRMRSLVSAWRELQDYFAPLIEARGKEPGEDLISMLAAGEREGAYTRDQCLASTVLLMSAGHATTMNLIANGVHSFVRNPNQWDLLRSDTDNLVRGAVEECLRYEPSVKGTSRICIEDVELAGESIQAGDRVFWIVSAANRDPAVFTDPDRFDIERSPNPHVAFGGGIHHCLGASLARIEAQEAFRALAASLPRIRLDEPGPVEYLPNKLEREVRSLNVRWD